MNVAIQRATLPTSHSISIEPQCFGCSAGRIFHTVEDEAIDPQAPEIADSRTYLAVNVRFDNGADWAILRARLSATDGVAGIDVVRRTAHDAQIYLSYSDDVEQLRSALAQSALQLTNSDGGYTLQLGSASTTIASLGAPSRPNRD